jgi:ECF sigma factor
MGRKKKSEQLVGIELLLDGFTEMLMSYDYEALTICMDLEKRLQSDMLTPSDRQTVAFRFFAGLTNREVAHVLGKSEKAIEKRIDQWCDRWTDALVGDGTPVNQRVSPGLHISFHPTSTNGMRTYYIIATSGGLFQPLYVALY